MRLYGKCRTQSQVLGPFMEGSTKMCIRHQIESFWFTKARGAVYRYGEQVKVKDAFTDQLVRLRYSSHTRLSFHAYYNLLVGAVYTIFFCVSTYRLVSDAVLSHDEDFGRRPSGSSGECNSHLEEKLRAVSNSG
jgi:hypothetical protein